MAITPLPTPPLRSDDPVTFASRADALLSALPAFVTEVNALGIDQAGTYAANAAASAASAAAAANFAGEWGGLVGDLAVPASVEHSDRLWLLLNDLADVTASEPGVTADWQVLPSLPYVTSRTSNTILARADFGTILQVSGATWTQTLTAAATLGNGWWCIVKNTGAAHIVVDPDGAELIDGVATCVINPLEERLIVCTGTAFITTVLKPFYMEFTADGTFTKPLSGYSRIGGALWGGGGSGAVNVATSTAGGAGGGGGGACVSFQFALADAGATAAVVVGAGGAAAVRTTNGQTAGNAGGNSTIGLTAKTITAYGAAGGTANATTGSVTGGGGGGWLSAGNTAAGGSPTNVGDVNSHCGGGKGADGSSGAGSSAFGGAGGSAQGFAAGSSSYGGGGGGSSATPALQLLAAGTSIFGGNGGAAAGAASGVVAATAGAVPGGGGGGVSNHSETSTTSGAGGNGLCILWGIV